MKKSDQKIRQFIFALSIVSVGSLSPHVLSITTEMGALFNPEVNDQEVAAVFRVAASDPSSTPSESRKKSEKSEGDEDTAGEVRDGDSSAANKVGDGAEAGKSEEETTPCRNCTLEKTHSYKYAEELLKSDDLSAERKAELAKILDGILNDSAEINQRTADIAAATERLTGEEAKEGGEKNSEGDGEVKDKAVQALDEKTKELDTKVNGLAESVKALSPFLANMLNGGGQGVADANDEKRAEMKKMHSQVREAVRQAWRSNASAVANVRFMIAAYERRLAKLDRAGKGDSKVAIQARGNVEELKKTLVNLEQQKGRILLSKRDANYEYEKSNRKPSSTLLSFFTPADVMDEINYKRMQNSADKLDQITNDLADIEALSTSVEAVAGGNGGVQDLQAIDGWLAVYSKKNQGATPNPVAYDPGLTRRDGTFRDNSFLLPVFKGPKSINGRPI